ncbi:MAG: hypothetical protein HOP19_23185 [Acidobacteria bacterium]|nr:hypothetical protein [Acidobacteriota bacterium]
MAVERSHDRVVQTFFLSGDFNRLMQERKPFSHAIGKGLTQLNQHLAAAKRGGAKFALPLFGV